MTGSRRKLARGEAIEFIHVPRPETGIYPNVALLPIGLPALADLVERMGHPAHITHWGLEKLLHPERDPIATLHEAGLRVFLLDLHWHYQSAHVLDLAAKLRAAIPEALIIVGGITASCFHRELAALDDLDFVIRGDGEVPLARLLAALSAPGGEARLTQVPNLSYRQGAELVSTPLGYAIDAPLLDSLRFTRFELIRDHAHCLRLKLNRDYSDTAALAQEAPIFHYNVGRGCPVDCSFCGGGKSAQKRFCGRTRPVLAHQDAVCRELAAARSYGIDTWFTCFDPEPKGPYYPALFRCMKTLGLDFNVIFESWGLPGGDFLESFAENLLPGSVLVLSPESGSDEIRRKNKGFHYSTAELLATLDACERLGIRAELYFTAGLPFEQWRQVLETRELIATLKRRHPTLQISVFPLELEPGSLMHGKGPSLGVSSDRSSLESFVAASRGPAQIGYRTVPLSPQDVLRAVALLKEAALGQDSEATQQTEHA